MVVEWILTGFIKEWLDFLILHIATFGRIKEFMLVKVDISKKAYIHIFEIHGLEQ